MTTPHRATPEQWRQLQALDQRYVANIDLRDLIVFRGIILELADRLAAAEQRISELENAAEPQITPEEAEMIAAPWSLITPEPKPAAPTGSLVEVVAGAIADSDDPHELWYDDARAAIREVAAWFEQESWGWCDSAAETVKKMAATLRKEAER